MKILICAQFVPQPVKSVNYSLDALNFLVAKETFFCFKRLELFYKQRNTYNYNQNLFTNIWQTTTKKKI